MVNFFLKEHFHPPGIIHHRLTSLRSKTVLHLSLRISFFAESKCLPVISTIYSKSGPQHFPATKTHPSMESKTCTILLTELLKAMHRGKISMSHTMAKYQRGIPLHGNTPSTTSGSAILELYYTISLGIPILRMSWISPPRKFEMRMVHVDMRTLCQVIGPGDRRYVFRCLETFEIISLMLLISGRARERSRKPWRNILCRYIGKRQDNCVRCHRPY